MPEHPFDPTKSAGLSQLAHIEQYLSATLPVAMNPFAVPAALGLIAWTADPFIATLSVTTDTTGNMRGTAIWVPGGKTITNVACCLTSAGGTVTHGILGLADANYNVLAQTADTPTAFQASGWANAGGLQTPYTTPAGSGQLLYIIELVSASVMPGFLCTASTVSPGFSARNQMPNSTYRAFFQGGVSTSFPATLVPGGALGNNRVYILY